MAKPGYIYDLSSEPFEGCVVLNWGFTWIHTVFLEGIFE